MTQHDQDLMSVLPLEGAGSLSTPHVREALARLGLNFAHTKTVQRMLERLERANHVTGERKGRTLYWSRLKGARGLGDGRGSLMTFDDALALQTLRRFSSRQIPTLVSQSLSSLFDLAERRLASPKDEVEQRYARWSGKVAVESGAFSLNLPHINPDIFSVITRALFEERRLNVVYRPRSNLNNEAWQEILPFGLVEVGGTIYLIGGRDGKRDPSMYRINRVTQAKLSAMSFQYPDWFNLNTYVSEQRQFDFFVEREISLRLRFFAGSGEHLLESPLATDQTHCRNGDKLEISGTVKLSQRLRWWIRSFGPNVEVLEPASLRAQMATESRIQANRYANEHN